MDGYFDLLSGLGHASADRGQPSDSLEGLRRTVSGGIQLLQLIVADGDDRMLRRFAAESARAADRLEAPDLDRADEAQLLACLALLARLSLRLVEHVTPRREVERLLGRSELAKMALREIAHRDQVRAAVLRRDLERHLRRRLTQTNLSRVVKKLAATGWVSIDRTSDGVPWYRITLQGHAAARELFDDVPAPVPAAAGSMQHRTDGTLMAHYEATIGAAYTYGPPRRAVGED